MEVIVATWLVPLLVVVAGGLLIRGQGSVRGVRYWVGLALMLTGPIAFLYMQFDILLNVLLLPRHASWYEWWSALFLALLIALVAVLAIPSLRSRRWLVWPVVGGVLLLPAALLIALVAESLLGPRLPEPKATASVYGVIVNADDLDRAVVEDAAGRKVEVALHYPFAVWAPRPIILPEAGDLLLVARFAAENETWFVVAGQTYGCEFYGVEFYSAWDLEDAIVGAESASGHYDDRGIRLPKAAGYREEVRPAWNGLWSPYAQFCLNREGEVVSSNSVGVP